MITAFFIKKKSFPALTTYFEVNPGVASQVSEVVHGDETVRRDVEGVGVHHDKLHAVRQAAVGKLDNWVFELGVQRVCGVDDDVGVVHVGALHR